MNTCNSTLLLLLIHDDDVDDAFTTMYMQVGRIIHKDMQGGLQGDSQTTGLTAYVVISLLEANVPSTVGFLGLYLATMIITPVDSSVNYASLSNDYILFHCD